MRILLVGMDVPNKTTGAQKRCYYLMKALVDAGHELHRINILFGDCASVLADVKELGITCYPVHGSSPSKPIAAYFLKRVMTRVLNFVQWRWTMVCSIIDPMPKSVKAHWVRPLRMELEKILREHQFDLVVIEHEQNAELVKSIPLKIPVVLDAHNVLSCMVEREYQLNRRQLGLSLFRLSERCQPRKFRRLERQILTRYDRVIVTSDLEANRLRDLAPDHGGRVSVIPNGVDLSAFRPNLVSQWRDRVIFTGLMSYGPNVDAVKWLLHDIWPRVLHERPTACLDIVGVDPPVSLYELAANFGPQVRITGRVESVVPYFDAANVFVAPLRLGGGTRLKILESAAMCRPIVATTIAAEGLDGLSDGAHLLLRDDPQAFADAIVQLLRDEALSRRLSESARYAVECRYDWASIGHEFEHLLRRVVGAANQTSSVSLAS